MTRLLSASAPDFQTQYQALLQTRGDAVDGVEGRVAAILADVKARGFNALADSAKSLMILF